MKKTMNKVTVALMALMFVFVACLVGVTTLTAWAASNQEEPTVDSVQLTSFTTVMSVDEEFTFSAQVIYSDGSVSDEVTWSSSNEDVISMDENIATAYEAGSATITATAADGAFASVSVLVSNSAIRVESVTVSPESLER